MYSRNILIIDLKVAVPSDMVIVSSLFSKIGNRLSFPTVQISIMLGLKILASHDALKSSVNDSIMQRF